MNHTQKHSNLHVKSIQKIELKQTDGRMDGWYLLLHLPGYKVVVIRYSYWLLYKEALTLH